MLRVVCFGAGGGGKRLFEKIAEKYEVVAFVDNDKSKWGKTLFQIPICEPAELDNIIFDRIIITSAPGLDSVKMQCLNKGIPEEKIITSYVENSLESRIVFLKTLASMQEIREMPGACAEAGVFEGDFAKYINEYFPDRMLYLFDTFKGFDARDVIKEGGFSNAVSGDYNNTSVKMVMKKMPYPSNCLIYEGYFPESAQGLDEKFCFVNLDLDLYEPTYNGLCFFCDKMVSGGGNTGT